jgi:CHAD domain-containing protein
MPIRTRPCDASRGSTIDKLSCEPSNVNDFYDSVLHDSVFIRTGTMAFHLKKGEAVVKGARRLVRRQTERALEALRRDSDDDVHDARKRFKRIRAVLRLVRDELGDRAYRRANRCFRDAARPLAEVRDAKVLLETLKSVAAEDMPCALSVNLKAYFEQERVAIRRRLLKDQHALKKAAEIAAGPCARLEPSKVSHKGWAALRGGLKRVYKLGRDALSAAHADPSVTSLHEWRKQAKYLWHQLQLLQPIQPGFIGAASDRVHQLTKLLGDDHDLAMLREQVTRGRMADRGEDVKKLLAVIDRRRDHLQKKAFQLGERVYCARPKAFVERIKACWKAWD